MERDKRREKPLHAASRCHSRIICCLLLLALNSRISGKWDERAGSTRIMHIIPRSCATEYDPASHTLDDDDDDHEAEHAHMAEVRKIFAVTIEKKEQKRENACACIVLAIVVTRGDAAKIPVWNH